MKIHMIAYPDIDLSDPIFVCDLRELPLGFSKMISCVKNVIRGRVLG